MWGYSYYECEELLLSIEESCDEMIYGVSNLEWDYAVIAALLNEVPLLLLYKVSTLLL